MLALGSKRWRPGTSDLVQQLVTAVVLVLEVALFSIGFRVIVPPTILLYLIFVCLIPDTWYLVVVLFLFTSVPDMVYSSRVLVFLLTKLA